MKAIELLGNTSALQHVGERILNLMFGRNESWILALNLISHEMGRYRLTAASDNPTHRASDATHFENEHFK